MRILAHQQMHEQSDRLAGGGQLVQSAHRHVDFVTDSVDVDEDHGGAFFQQDAAQSSNHSVSRIHTSRPLRMRYPAVASRPMPCPPCA